MNRVGRSPDNAFVRILRNNCRAVLGFEPAATMRIRCAALARCWRVVGGLRPEANEFVLISTALGAVLTLIMGCIDGVLTWISASIHRKAEKSGSLNAHPLATIQ